MSTQVRTRGCVRTLSLTHTHTAAAIEKRCAYRFLIPWPRDSRGETGSEERDQKWNRGRQGCASKPCPHQVATWASISVSDSGRKVTDVTLHPHSEMFVETNRFEEYLIKRGHVHEIN